MRGLGKDLGPGTWDLGPGTRDQGRNLGEETMDYLPPCGQTDRHLSKHYLLVVLRKRAVNDYKNSTKHKEYMDKRGIGIQGKIRGMY